MACTSLIPNSGHNRARKQCFPDLAAILLCDNHASLKVPLPDDHRLVDLVAHSQKISGIVQRELTRQPAARWSTLKE
jgi:hypothetical protein